MLVDACQLLAQQGNAIANDPAVRFNFFLSWTLHADATFLLLKVGPHVGEAGQQVLVLGQFHLGLCVSRRGPLGKNVEDEVGPVEHLSLGNLLFDVAELNGTEFIVEDDHVDVLFLDEFLDLLELA